MNVTPDRHDAGMARAPRSGQQSGWHHVTNRGIDRQDVFRSVDDRVDFGRLIASGHDKFGVEVFAYCLMGNHFHLVLSCPRGGLSAFMQDVGAKFTRHTNERHGGDGAVFRGRFFSRVIPSNEYLLNAVRYVHRNPLDLRPRVAPAEYRWSSHRTYLGLRPAPPWLSTSPVLDWFESAHAFHAFVSAEPGGQPIATTADDITAAIAQVVDELAGHLDRAPQGIARTATYVLLDRVDASTRAELVDRLAPDNAAAPRTGGAPVASRGRTEPAGCPDR